MKKIKLPVNQCVTFDAEAHTYTLYDGKVLSGITSIIHKYLFPDMYSGVASSIMEAARDRGHAVHDELERLFHGEPNELLVQPETHEYIRLKDEYRLKQIAAEYLVSDNENIATCIDSVLFDKNGIALVDYKTTSVLYEEYLQWQLSIEAFLFEKQTNIPVINLYAIHLPKGKEAKLVSIQRLPNNYVIDLLEAFKSDAETFENPLHQLSDDACELLTAYREAERELVELRAAVKYNEDIQAAIKAKFKEMMDAESASKWEKDDVTITRGKDSIRKTFKPDKLRELADENVSKWLDDNMDKCYAETKVNGNVTIKFK